MPGIAFRQTAGYVTDGTGDTYCLADAYSVTRGGVTFGWESLTGVSGRNRSTTVDPKLAGVNRRSNAATSDFRIDLPSTGTYDIRLAMGDATVPASAGAVVAIYDGTTLVTTISGSTLAGEFYDATGVLRTSAADWITNNAAYQHTFTTTILRFRVGNTGASSGTDSNIAYASYESVGGGGATTILPQMQAQGLFVRGMAA